jgi:hypothetical protein
MNGDESVDPLLEQPVSMYRSWPGISGYKFIKSIRTLSHFSPRFSLHRWQTWGSLNRLGALLGSQSFTN